MPGPESEVGRHINPVVMPREEEAVNSLVLFHECIRVLNVAR